MDKKKGVNLRNLPAHRGTAKHQKGLKIAKGTHPLGALTKLFSPFL